MYSKLLTTLGGASAVMAVKKITSNIMTSEYAVLMHSLLPKTNERKKVIYIVYTRKSSCSGRNILMHKTKQII